MIKFITRIGFPITFFAALWLKYVRNAGIGKLEERVFMKIGILPITDHYYEPLINPKKHLTKSLNTDRELPGIDFNVTEQLSLLNKFNYNDELMHFPINKIVEHEFYYNNDFYEAGDAEYLYSMIRHFKPRKIIEIGSGYSTLMAQTALAKNKAENADYGYQHYCIEPYERLWLEDLDVTVIREKVENIDKEFFRKLEANDILFIDSTHIIRPQGDVLFEYLEILPIVKPGVIVHVHDIFMPKDYPEDWIYKKHRLWNEQYLLEAFLTFNNKFKIIGALNYLSHKHKTKLIAKCPIFEQTGNEPGAFWMVRVE